MSENKIHPLISKRFSPAVFADKDIEAEKLLRLFDAARWAASCFNEQPWRFVVATRQQTEAFQKILGTLGEANQLWAKAPPVLMITLAKKNFTARDKANRHAWHDVGLAMGNLTLQAAADDLYLHQMAGFSPEKAQEVLQIPEEFESIAAVAIGYLGDATNAPEPIKQKHEKQRTRKGMEEVVFGEGFGKPFFS